MNAPQELQQTIISCTLCPRLVEHRQRVAQGKRRMYREWDYWGRPLPSLGDPEAHVLVIGLAPAAHGGNRRGRMFTSDHSGDWLYGTLYSFGFATTPYSHHRQDGLALRDLHRLIRGFCRAPRYVGARAQGMGPEWIESNVGAEPYRGIP